MESHHHRRVAEEEPEALALAETSAARDSLTAEEDSTLEVARLLWQQRLWLWRVTACAFVISVVVTLLVPNRYTSTTRIMPPDNSGSNAAALLTAMLGKSVPGLSAFAGQLLPAKNSGALFVALLQSRTVEDHIIDRFDLRKVYWDRYWEDARKHLRKHTDISEDRKSGVITLEVTDKDPRRAAAMAQAYVEELDRLVAQVSTSSARQERMFIEQRLQIVKADLDQAQRAFSQFASQNAALDIGQQAKAMVESAAELQGQLIAAESQLRGLEQIYAANNFRIRSLRARVAELRRQLEKIGGTDAALANAAGQKEGNAASQKEIYPSLRKLPLLGVEWANLYRETRIQETVYELLTQQYELARIQEAKEVPVVNVADPANVPEKKSFPPRLIIVSLVTVLAFAAAGTWSVAVHRWQAAKPQNGWRPFLAEVCQQITIGGSKLRQHSKRVFRLKHSRQTSIEN